MYSLFSLFSIPSDYFGMLNKQSMKNFREDASNNHFFESTTTTTEQKLEIKMTEFEQIKELANLGDAENQSTMGFIYSNGLCGVEKNYAEAVRWYTKAAEQGNAIAQTNLGFMYANGEGVKQDYAEAVRWYTKAAEQGDANAQINLGDMYYKGQGVEVSKTEALKWMTKASEQGDPDAKNWVDTKKWNLKINEFEKIKVQAEQGDASEKDDAISPSHYKQGDIECIDAIRAMTSSMHGDGFKIACLKDVVKYVWRHEFKGGLEDLKKARWYLDKAIKQMEHKKD